MKKFSKSISTIIIIIAIVLLFVPKGKFVRFSNTDLAEYYPKYILSAEKQEDYERYSIYYPPVSVKPGTTKYALLRYYEDYQIWIKQFDSLFFATKRINELVTWGNELPVQSTSGKAASWRSVLQRYTDLLNAQIKETDGIIDEGVRNEKREELKRYIVQHSKKINSLIDSRTFDAHKREIIRKLIADIYSKYEKRLGILKENNVYKTAYSLSKIISNEDFGLYKAVIDKADIPFYDAQIVLKLGETSYSSHVDSLTKNEGFIYFDNIKIDHKVAQNLQLDEAKKIYSPQFLPVGNSNTKETIFYADISNLIPFGESTIQTFPLSTENNLKFLKSESPITHQSDLFNILKSGNDQYVHTLGNTSDIVRREYLDKERYVYAVIVPTTANNIASFSGRIEITSKTTPKIYLQKVGYLYRPTITFYQSNAQYQINVAHISVSQLQQILSAESASFILASNQKTSIGSYLLSFKPKQNILISFILLIFGVVGIFVSSINKQLVRLIDLRNNMQKALAKRYQSKVKLISLYLKRYSLVLFGSTIFFIIFEMFILKRNIDVIDAALCLLLLIIAYLNDSITIIFRFICFTFLLSLLLFVLHKESFRIAADWTFLLFIFFIVQMWFSKKSD